MIKVTTGYCRIYKIRDLQFECEVKYPFLYPLVKKCKIEIRLGKVGKWYGFRTIKKSSAQDIEADDLIKSLINEYLIENNIPLY